MIGTGTVMGWPSVSIGTLQSEWTPLDSPISTLEISWVVSLFCVGGLVGTILFGLITNLVGRKMYLLLLAVPMIVRSFKIVLV